MPGQDRIERMLREVWQRCRVRFEQALRPFEIALGECLNELFKDSTDRPSRWAAFVAEWHARGVLVSEPSQRAIEQLLDLVARKQPIPRDPSGRYFTPTVAARPAAPAPNNATSPNWPALTGPQREQIQGETGLAWWHPYQPVVPGDQVWEYLLAAKARAARGKLLDFFLALQALGALADAVGEEGDDGLEAIQNQAAHVRDAYDNYVASYIALQQRWLQYLQYQPFLGMYVAGLMRKVDAGLPPSVLGLHSKYERELLEVQAEIVNASSSLSTRVDVAYTVAVWTDRAITVIEAATFFLSAGAVAKTALTKALAAGATRSAAVNLAIRAGLKQAVVQAVQQLAIGAVLPEVLIAAGLDEKQVRQGLVLLDAAPMLLNLRTLKAELSRPKPSATRETAKTPRGGEGSDGFLQRSLPDVTAREATASSVPPVRYSPFQVRIDPFTRRGPMAIDTSGFSGADRTIRGGVRNARQFWKSWSIRYTDSLSLDNRARIRLGRSPTVDSTWVLHFPEHSAYLGDTLVHHHLDFGPMAIPLPASVHGLQPGWDIWHRH